MSIVPFVNIAEDLETAGLIWCPEIGDEITPRQNKEVVSILVDPQGMTPKELRSHYLWLPNSEQLIEQFEARQAILYHAGLELSESGICYKTVIRSNLGLIESYAENFRTSLGLALKNLLKGDKSDISMH